MWPHDYESTDRPISHLLVNWQRLNARGKNKAENSVWTHCNGYNPNWPSLFTTNLCGGSVFTSLTGWFKDQWLEDYESHKHATVKRKLTLIYRNTNWPKSLRKSLLKQCFRRALTDGLISITFRWDCFSVLVKIATIWIQARQKLNGTFLIYLHIEESVHIMIWDLYFPFAHYFTFSTASNN